MPRVRTLLAVLAAVLGTLVLVPVAQAARPVVSVVGNQLVDSSSGAPVPLQLRGVDRSGTEYACASDVGAAKRGYAIFDGPTYDSAKDADPARQGPTLAAMETWGINAVRVPLSDACWFGSDALNTAYSGDAYRRAVLAYVDLLADHGMVAILSLHVASPTPSGNLGLRLLPMPEATEGPRFWKDVVQELAKSPRRNVVLDAFNEPHLEDVPAAQRWACWRNGCRVDPAPTDAPPAADPTPAYETAGMQQLVTAIREKERDTGGSDAPRPIMVGGLDYANDLSGWLANVPSDPKNALVASFHAYAGTQCATVGCWDATIAPILRGTTPRPVVTGEVGQYDCRSDFARAYASWADAQAAGDGAAVSYLAWTWNATRTGAAATPGAATGWRCDDSPSLLKYNDGTPTDAYGLVWCQRLRSSAGLPGAAGATNPCPASRVPSEEHPADATPPVVTPPPGPGTTPTSPGTPTTTTAPAADPFPAPVTTPTVPTTTVQPATLPPATVPRPVEPRTARISSSALRLARGKVALLVTCAKGATPCRGRVKVRTARKVALGRRRAVLVLLSVAYDVRAGTSAKLVVTPTADGRRLLKRTRRVPAVATATSTGGLPTVKRLTLSR